MDASARDRIPVARVFALLDGVVAIAMTVLVLDLRLPPGLTGRPLDDAVQDLGYQVLYFLLSVAVIGLFWRGHHEVMREASYVDTPLLWFNFIFLALISAIPIPTNALENYGDQTVGPALYGLTVGLTALAELVMWRHITRRGGPAMDSVAPARRWAVTRTLLTTVVIFLGSIGVAFASPRAAAWCWLLLIPVRMAERRWGRRRPAEDSLPPDRSSDQTST